MATRDVEDSGARELIEPPGPWALLWPGATAVALFLLGLAVTAFVANLEERRRASEARADVTAALGALRGRLEAELNSTVFLTQGLVTLVATQGDIRPEQFDAYTAELMRHGRHIRNIGLAPGNVIRYLFPLAGNEAALGLDYLSHPVQRVGVQRAMQQRGTVLVGPIALVQGGRAVVGRTPIFRAEGAAGGETGSYWGMASVVIDYESLVTAAGLDAARQGLRLALRGGDDDTLFWGDADALHHDPVTLDVDLPGTRWQLIGLPRDGWPEAGGWFTRYVLGGLSLSLLLAALVLRMLMDRQHIRELALRDPLTQLANRRQLRARLVRAITESRREGGRFALLQIDLDGFKPVNDRWGHEVGDEVLRRIGARMRDLVRGRDTLGRLGGDEFLLILRGERAGEAAVIARVARRVLEAIAEPMAIDGLSLRVGASLGVALYPDDAGDMPGLLRRADEALYRAKRAGGHCWRHADPARDAP